MGIIERDIGRVSIVPKGTWNNSNTYTRLDLVNYNGNSYIAKQDVPININLNNTNYWKLVAEKGTSISSITRTGTSPNGLIDTYTINFTDGTSTTFNVNHGAGISNITGPVSDGLTDTYTINFTDGRTSTFEIKNGNGIFSITKTGTSVDGLTDTYTITFEDSTFTTFNVNHGVGISNITGPVSNGLIDTYTINFTDGTSTTFEVKNAKSITSITGIDVNPIAGHTDTYRINYNDNTYFDYQIYNGRNGAGIVSTVDGIIPDDVDVELLIFGNSAPTENTVGQLKQRYYDRTNEILYICTGIDNTGAQPIYTWQGTGVPVDNELSTVSQNPVQNKVITGKIGTTELSTTAKNLSDAVNELNTNKQEKININGILKADNSEGIIAAVAGEDYAIPSQVPIAANTTPFMNGTASAGNSTTFSRSDHIHPEDSNLRNAIDMLCLESTGDTNDRTDEIISRLQNYKKCVLGTGIFYTTGINMPDGSSLIGSGDATTLFKDNERSNTNYVVNMNKNNTISNLCIDGNNNNITETIGTHHGILWEGNYSTNSSAAATWPQNGKLSNLTIKNCDGGGITCNNTGTKRFNNIVACNVAIMNCNTGINIPYYSEYHRFTNFDVFECYYGCINNGGNNCFANCDFSDSKSIGFVIDNPDFTIEEPDNNKKNNSHGTCVGCSFNHIANNTGLALSLKGVGNGFTFGNCNIFRGSVEIINSTGVEITDSLFGEDLSITISNSQAIVFSDLSFQNNPTITITESPSTYFKNCLNYKTGGYIPESVGLEDRIDQNFFVHVTDPFLSVESLTSYLQNLETYSVSIVRMGGGTAPSTSPSNAFFQADIQQPAICLILKSSSLYAYFFAMARQLASVGVINLTTNVVAPKDLVTT